MGKPRKRYTTEFKIEAIRLLVTNGAGLLRTRRQPNWRKETCSSLWWNAAIPAW